MLLALIRVVTAIAAGFALGSVISEIIRPRRERSKRTVWTGIAEQFTKEYVHFDSRATTRRNAKLRAWRRHHDF